MEDKDLLFEMSEKLIRIEQRQKTARVVRIVIAGILISLIIAAALWLTPHVQEVKDTAAQLQKTMPQINSFISAMGAVDVDDISSLMDNSKNVDLEGLNTLVTNLGNMDLNALNNLVTRLESISETLNTIGSFFG